VAGVWARRWSPRGTRWTTCTPGGIRPVGSGPRTTVPRRSTSGPLGRTTPGAGSTGAGGWRPAAAVRAGRRPLLRVGPARPRGAGRARHSTQRLIRGWSPNRVTRWPLATDEHQFEEVGGVHYPEHIDRGAGASGAGDRFTHVGLTGRDPPRPSPGVGR